MEASCCEKEYYSVLEQRSAENGDSYSVDILVENSQPWRGRVAPQCNHREQKLLCSMAATRLRKTFQYPADNSDDDDDIPKDLDEEGYCS